MITAIDSNVLVALWNEDDELNMSAQRALDEARSSSGIVVNGAVYAELLAEPGRDEEFLDRFFEGAAIRVEWELSEKIWKEAGRAYGGYAARRRRQREGGPRRILADFLIGAHALIKGYKLLTLDARTYQAAFPRLAIISV
jgi:predicted nucleic acid-binding protein